MSDKSHHTSLILIPSSFPTVIFKLSNSSVKSYQNPSYLPINMSLKRSGLSCENSNRIQTLLKHFEDQSESLDFFQPLDYKMPRLRRLPSNNQEAKWSCPP